MRTPYKRKLSRHAVLLSHKNPGEDAKHRKSGAFHRDFWAIHCGEAQVYGTVPNRSRTVRILQNKGWWWIGILLMPKFISGINNITIQQKRRVSHAAPPHPNSHPSPPKKTKKKNSSSANTWVLVNKNPAPCYSPTVKFAVPSPLRSLTTVFGKGTCVTTSLWAPEKNQIKKIISIKSNIRTTGCDTFFTYTPEKGNMRKKVVKPHDI